MQLVEGDEFVDKETKDLVLAGTVSVNNEAKTLYVLKDRWMKVSAASGTESTSGINAFAAGKAIGTPDGTGKSATTTFQVGVVEITVQKAGKLPTTPEEIVRAIEDYLTDVTYGANVEYANSTVTATIADAAGMAYLTEAGKNGRTATDDLARFLKALHTVSGQTTVTYNGNTYTWAVTDTTSEGQYYNNGKTIVAAMTEAVQAELGNSVSFDTFAGVTIGIGTADGDITFQIVKGE